ncbi:MAG: sulfite exporter TauE/SafE family protein [Burkholderiales bacterium]|nr:sulfite exporter TauE/SafE family protein [Burkholderiales bacterium]
MAELSLPFDTATLVIAAAIVFAAYVVFGMTGFGSSIAAMPFLALLFPLKVAVPLMAVIDLCSGSMLALRTHRQVAWRELSTLAPWIALGMIAGVTLLVRAPERVLLTLLAVFVLAYLARTRFGRPAREPVSERWASAFGASGGVVTALYGTGGPIYLVYLLRRLADPRALRATMGMMILLLALARVTFFAGADLYTGTGLVALCVLLVPVGLAGLWTGSHLHHRVPPQHVMGVLHLVLFAGALNLLYRALFS